MPSLKINSSTQKKYTSPFLYIHYILLLAVLYYFGVDLYLKHIQPMLTRLGVELESQVSILFWNPTLDSIFMVAFFFVVLVVGDIAIHIILGKTTGWKD